MTVNQILNPHFSTAGKGGYKISEVDEFLKMVHQDYVKFSSENSTLKERLAKITPLIDEYNENKKAIVATLVGAQNTADSLVNSANKQASQILDDAKTEAERLIASKTAEAELVYADKIREAADELEKTNNELARVKSEIIVLSEKYIDEINKKAKNLIDDANAKASKIVADAYSDAKTAKAGAEVALAETKAQLEVLRGDIASLKFQAQQLATEITQAASKVETDKNDLFELSEGETVEAEQIDYNDIPDFTADISPASDDTNEVLTEKAADSEFSMPDVDAYVSRFFPNSDDKENDAPMNFGDKIFEGTGISFEDIDLTTDEEDSDSEE